jgi:hypothetical protein
VSAVIFGAMHSTPHHPRRRWDGSRRTSAPARRPLCLAADAASSLLRAGQISRCRDCGNTVEWYYRPDHRPVPLHPSELPAAAVPEARRWHVSAGIAYAAGDASPWCRLPHSAVCPARPHDPALTHLTVLRRRLAAHSRRLIDTGTFTPRPAADPDQTSCRPARPVLQILGIRYLAARPLEDLRCLARATTTRARCTRPLPDPNHPAGVWRLLPATATTGQLALPAGLLMAVYDLSALPTGEQLRWRTQRCPHHTTTVAEMAATDFEPFDPLLHRSHIHPRLPGHHRPGTRHAHPHR